MSHRRPATTLLALTAPILLAACASGEPALELAPAPQVVTIIADDFTYDAPAQISAGVTTFRLVADGPTFHHALIVKLEEGKTFDDLVAAFQQPGPPPEWAVPVGGPNAPVPGGGIANATMELEPGNYAIVCMVDVPDGVPHVAHGMMRPLTVTPADPDAVPAALPTPDVRVTLFDYNFDFSAPVTAGLRTFEVVGAPGQPHEIELVRLEPGKTAMDMLQWVETPDGPPPGTPLGGTAPAVAGRSVFFEADMQPGRYAMICFLPDATDGKPHFVHGMVYEFSVE
jgi:hypothetical protein